MNILPFLCVILLFVVIGIITIAFVLLMPIAAQAATKSFTFNMEHFLSIGVYTSTKGIVNMSSWGGDTFFTIHLYEKSSGSNILVDKLEFSKSASGSPYTDTSYAVKKGKNTLTKYGKIKTRKEFKVQEV